MRWFRRGRKTSGGRPPVPVAELRSENLRVYVTDEEKEEIELLAEAEMVSVSTVIRWAIRDALERRKAKV